MPIQFEVDDLYNMLQLRVDKLKQRQNMSGLGGIPEAGMGYKIGGLRQALTRWTQGRQRGQGMPGLPKLPKTGGKL